MYASCRQNGVATWPILPARHVGLGARLDYAVRFTLLDIDARVVLLQHIARASSGRCFTQ